MNQRAPLPRILCIALVIGLMAALVAQPARAVPPLPSDFWGYVTIDGSPAPAGTQVAATVNGVTFQTATINDGGQALYLLSANGDDSSTPGVEGGTDGQTVAFQVGGVSVAQTGVWHSGSNARVDLARTTAPATPATIASASPTSAALGANANIVVTGNATHFAAGATQVSFGAGVTVNSVTVSSATQLTANITVAESAVPSKRTVTATTGSEVAAKSNAFTVLANSLDVYLPTNAVGAIGATVSLAITMPPNYTGRTVVAYSFKVTADPAVLQFTGVDKAGTLSADWSVQERHDVAGEIGVVAFGTTNLGADGVLLKLLAKVNGSNGAGTPLQFTTFTFNEGTPPASAYNGSFTSSGLAITGRVTYAAGSIPVPGTVLTLTGVTNMTTISGVDGIYRLPVTAGNNYTVTPGNGVRYSGAAISPLDAARVAQCILGSRPMTDCPLSLADTNNSKSITAYDASVIARYAVSLTNPASFVGNWVLEPAKRSYTNVQASQLDQNYQAYIRGDVTASWGQGAAAAASAAGKARLLAPAAAEGGLLVTPLRLAAPAPEDLIAYQFEVQYDPALLQFTGADVAGTLSDGWEVVWNEDAPGHVLAAAFAVQPLAGEGDLLRLLFTVTGAADLPASFATIGVSPIAFNEGAVVMDVTLDLGVLLEQNLYLPAISTGQ